LDRGEKTDTRDVINTLKYQVPWEEFVPVFARAMGFDWSLGTTLDFGMSRYGNFQVEKSQLLPDNPDQSELNDADDYALEEFTKRRSKYDKDDSRNPKNQVASWFFKLNFQVEDFRVENSVENVGERTRRATLWKLNSFRDILGIFREISLKFQRIRREK
jgi:hypothetical protein